MILNKEFPASIEQTENVIDFLQETLTAFSLPMKVIYSINIAVEEIFTNIAKFAYEDGKGKMNLTIEKDDSSLRIKLADSGKPFNPLEAEEPDISIGAEERPIGGLGIFMVKKMMDEVNYQYINEQNVLEIVKKL